MQNESSRDIQSTDVISAADLSPAGEKFEVSVVIPVRNEAESLEELIASLKAQTYPPAEIVIVDGGSTDGTIALARRLAAEDETLRLIEAGEATPGRGRNIGTAAARWEWIAFCDAGNQLETQWLERLTEVVRSDPEVSFIYGNFEPVINSFFIRCASLAYIPPKQARPGGPIRAPTIASALMRRDAWRQVGGFPDLRAAEDLIFMESIERHGFKTGWAPQATTWWRLQPTLGRTYKRFEVYSRCNVWAGRQRFWHYGIARQYLFALGFVLLALVHSGWWLVGLGLGFAARVVKRIWQRRENHPLLWLLNPIQFGGVALILLTIDLATFVGWAQALWQRPPSITARAETIGD
ncbi:MAG TPA: glycosyltransferase [Acidobacteriota bacterium]|jgi:glycosyltransferase involved in cell wall biosynthesis|nr:glycosyltransferase [Acidobacteriota bacterium]